METSPKRKILLVEDNPQNRYLASYLLKHHGYDVLSAVNAQEAMAHLRSTTVDLILLDIQLPDIDGYEIAAMVKRDERIANTPMVAVSSFAMPGDRQRAMSAGCDGYIEKPIDPIRFANQIEQFVRKP